MIRVREGTVTALLDKRAGITEIEVLVKGEPNRAINYDCLTGAVESGDTVLLNTTGVYKKLGTGGAHFVFANLSNRSIDVSDEGHIMKMRYAPGQVKVLAVEEEDHPCNPVFCRTRSLNGTPVIIGTLHSMLAPAVAAVHKVTGGRARVAYLMTDGAALPIVFSRLVAELKEKGLLTSTITCGHAFGGDYEAVTVYSGLLAARGAAGADIIIAAMGPGIVGTASEFGYTGLEQGEIINAVNILGGRAIAIPRISFADRRQRHYGLSHHTRTALGVVALTPCTVPLPAMSEDKNRLLEGQIESSGIGNKHLVTVIEADIVFQAMKELEIDHVTTMGRGMEDDPDFFLAAGAAGIYAAREWLSVKCV